VIQAVAIGPDQQVYSTSRAKGSTHVVAHSPAAARSLYETKEALRALWIAADGTCHTGGKRYHTNRGGSWTSHATIISEIYAMWGAGDELFLGGANGVVLHGRAGDWKHIASAMGSIYCITGTSARDVYIGGVGYLAHFDGTNVETLASSDLYEAICVCGEALWVSNGKAILSRSFAPLVTSEDALYGLGKGIGGLFVHGGYQLHRLDGTQLSLVHDNEDKALMIKRGEYATCMASDGRRVVAGGSRSVLVEDGLGFAEWPALSAAAAPTKSTKPKPTKQKQKSKA